MSQNFHLESIEELVEGLKQNPKSPLKQPGLVVLEAKMDLKINFEPEFTPCGLNLKELDVESLEGEEVWEDY